MEHRLQYKFTGGTMNNYFRILAYIFVCFFNFHATAADNEIGSGIDRQLKELEAGFCACDLSDVENKEDVLLAILNKKYGFTKEENPIDLDYINKLKRHSRSADYIYNYDMSDKSKDEKVQLLSDFKKHLLNQISNAKMEVKQHEDNAELNSIENESAVIKLFASAEKLFKEKNLEQYSRMKFKILPANVKHEDGVEYRYFTFNICVDNYKKSAIYKHECILPDNDKVDPLKNRVLLSRQLTTKLHDNLDSNFKMPNSVLHNHLIGQTSTMRRYQDSRRMWNQMRHQMLSEYLVFRKLDKTKEIGENWKEDDLSVDISWMNFK